MFVRNFELGFLISQSLVEAIQTNPSDRTFSISGLFRIGSAGLSVHSTSVVGPLILHGSAHNLETALWGSWPRRSVKGCGAMAKNKSVSGIYSTRSDVESAVIAFKGAGFSNSDISVLLPHPVIKEPVTENNTKAPEGAAVGVGSGAAVGGALGWLVGVGALAIPGIGPVIAAGPIVAALAGIGVGGALGGFAGCLIGVGISESDARRYEGRVLKGGILVAVHCETSGEIKRAREIMEDTRAEDIAERDGAIGEPG